MKVLNRRVRAQGDESGAGGQRFRLHDRAGSGMVGERKRRTAGPGRCKFRWVLTIDRNLRYQQTLTGRRMALLIVRARTNRVVDLEPHFSACAEALRTIQPGTVVEVGILSVGVLGKAAIPFFRGRVYGARKPSQGLRYASMNAHNPRP